MIEKGARVNPGLKRSALNIYVVKSKPIDKRVVRLFLQAGFRKYDQMIMNKARKEIINWKEEQIGMVVFLWKMKKLPLGL